MKFQSKASRLKTNKELMFKFKFECREKKKKTKTVSQLKDNQQSGRKNSCCLGESQPFCFALNLKIAEIKIRKT